MKSFSGVREIFEHERGKWDDTTNSRKIGKCHKYRFEAIKRLRKEILVITIGNLCYRAK